MSESKTELPDIDSLWDFSQPTETEQKFAGVLQRAPTEDLQYRCELLTQIARAQGLQRRFSEAQSTLDAAEALRCSSPRCLIRMLLERGRVLNSSGEKAKAKPFFLRAWEIAVESGVEALEVDAAHMMAFVEPPEVQLEWNEKAMATAERSSDPKARKWLGSLLNNTAWAYHDLAQYERALELFVKAMKFRMEQGQEPQLKIARWAVARCLRSMGRLDEALSMQLELEKDHAAAGTKDGFVREELGEILLAQGKSDEAKPHFAKAYELLSGDQWIVSDEPERLQRLKSLAD